MEALAIVLAILAIVVLAAVVIFAATRNRDADAAKGYVSRETAQRDKRASKAASATTAVATDTDADVDELVAPAVTGKEVERAATLARREDGGELVTVGAQAPVMWTPPDDEAIGVARRQFLNRSIVGLMSVSLGGFGTAVVAFLYGGPEGTGFGSVINVGKVEDVVAEIQGSNGFLYKPNGRMWVTQYPLTSIKKARAAYSGPELGGMESGLVALFQKCPHLGCRVPECLTSQWFECPCHGSQYNRVGEKRGGPAPRGMDRFAMSVNAEGEFLVDTGSVIQGPAIGTNTTGQEAEGPNCLSNSSH